MSLLQAGDTVGFVATSSGLEGRDITPAVKYFEQKLHLNVKLAPNLSSAYRYMAGTDQERAAALTQMYLDQDVKALFAIRGAAGSARMLEYLDFSLLAAYPKPLFGLSDVTSVQNALYAQAKQISYSGFLPIYDIKNGQIPSAQLENALKSVLFNDKNTLTGGTALINGSAAGEIIGGCLTSFLYLAGTKYMPDFKGKILLLEDTDEKTYKIDLLLNQLKQQKNFSLLNGIIIGKFSDCIMIDSFDGDINACIKDFTTGLNIPVISDFDYGHIPNRYILPIGHRVRISASPEKCTVSW